jgi:hypothetical protein
MNIEHEQTASAAGGAPWSEGSTRDSRNFGERRTLEELWRRRQALLSLFVDDCIHELNETFELTFSTAALDRDHEGAR